MSTQRVMKIIEETDGLEDLRRIRDEIRLQAHLFNAELKQEWKKLEKNWTVIKNDAVSIRPVLIKAVSETGKAAEPVAEELQAAYTKILGDLKKMGGHPT